MANSTHQVPCSGNNGDDVVGVAYEIDEAGWGEVVVVVEVVEVPLVRGQERAVLECGSHWLRSQGMNKYHKGALQVVFEEKDHPYSGNPVEVEGFADDFSILVPGPVGVRDMDH